MIYNFIGSEIQGHSLFSACNTHFVMQALWCSMRERSKIEKLTIFERKGIP
jgi:hypothetical protein